MKIENAQITGTFLGVEDHGCLTVFLHLKGDGWNVSWGGRNLGNATGFHNRGIEYIQKILDTVGVRSWEELAGKYIRIENHGLGSSIEKIGNLLEDLWLDNEEFFSK